MLRLPVVLFIAAMLWSVGISLHMLEAATQPVYKEQARAGQ